MTPIEIDAYPVEQIEVQIGTRSSESLSAEPVERVQAPAASVMTIDLEA